MASYTTEVETKTWLKVIVPAPATRSDMYLALHVADQEYERIHGRSAEEWDTAYTVETGDDEIVIRVEMPKGTN